MKPIHEEEIDGYKIQIFNDEDPISPVEEADENCFLVGYHREFSVEAPKNKAGYRIVSKDECIALFKGEKEAGESWPAELAKRYHFFGLEAYIHSGVRLAIAYEGNFCDRRWDVSQLGGIFIAKSEWRTRPKAKKAALGLISYYNDWLAGNVYGFKIIDPEGVELDSCWGYFGDYDQKDGILEEARKNVKFYQKEAPALAKGAGI